MFSVEIQLELLELNKNKQRTIKVNIKLDLDTSPFFGSLLSLSLLKSRVLDVRLALCTSDSRSRFDNSWNLYFKFSLI